MWEALGQEEPGTKPHRTAGMFQAPTLELEVPEGGLGRMDGISQTVTLEQEPEPAVIMRTDGIQIPEASPWRQTLEPPPVLLHHPPPPPRVPQPAKGGDGVLVGS